MGSRFVQSRRSHGASGGHSKGSSLVGSLKPAHRLTSFEIYIFPTHELTVLSDINWLICSFGQQIQQSFFPFLHSFWKWSSSGWVLQYFTQLFFFFSFYFRRNWMTKDIVILLPKRWMILLLFQYLGLYSAPQLLKLSLFVFIIT